MYINIDDNSMKSILILLISLYATLIAPKLPNNVLYFFDTLLGKFIIIFLIGYLASKKLDISIIVSLGFLITLHYLNKNKIDNYINYKSRELFTDLSASSLGTARTLPPYSYPICKEEGCEDMFIHNIVSTTQKRKIPLKSNSEMMLNEQWKKNNLNNLTEYNLSKDYTISSNLIDKNNLNDLNEEKSIELENLKENKLSLLNADSEENNYNENDDEDELFPNSKTKYIPQEIKTENDSDNMSGKKYDYVKTNYNLNVSCEYNKDNTDFVPNNNTRELYAPINF